MRFALSLASVLVLGSAAFAEEPAPPPPAPAPAPAAAPAAKKLPLRVVRVLDDTQQALLFDKAKSTHVLVEVGKQIDGFTVTDIDEDSVTLTAEGGQQIVLAGPDPSWRGHDRKAAQKAAAKKVVEAAPQDPYAGAAPMDPYGEDDGVRSASAATPSATAAPITAGEGGVRTAEAPAAATPTEGIRSAEAPGTPAKIVVTAAIPSSTIPTVAPSTVASTSTATAPTTPIVSTATPAVEPTPAPSAEPSAPQDTSSSAAWSTTPAPAVDPEAAAIADLFTTQPEPTAKPKAATKAGKTKQADKKIASVSPAGATPAVAAASDGATVIAKADVTAALGNFGALASAVRGSFGAEGAHLDAIAPDSLFAKAGLQAGDTITAVNNKPLRSLDDAATLYARAGTMKSATIQVTRAGKPISLRLAIQ